jgi:hypothetical protein
MKLTQARVVKLRADLARGMDQAAAGKKYGVSRSTVSDIACQRIWQPSGSAWERILIASDCHSVFLDRRAWNVFLAVCESARPDRVILNGDVMDCTSISDHARRVELFNPDVLEDYSFDAEIAFTHERILKPLRKAIGRAKLELRLGNHEMRFLRPNKANPAALAEIVKTCTKRRATRLEELLKLDKLAATLSYNHVDELYGTFTLIHGVKFSANAAHQNLLRYGSGTSGHSHRANCHTQAMRRDLQGWWESGCMRSCKNVEYLPHGDVPDWANAFLSLTINRRTGVFFCKTHFIIQGATEFNGQVFRA